jgi:hypothetical protein
LDAETKGPAFDPLGKTPRAPSGDPKRTPDPRRSANQGCGVERLFLTRLRRTPRQEAFRNSTHVLS